MHQEGTWQGKDKGWGSWSEDKYKQSAQVSLLGVVFGWWLGLDN